MSEYNNLRVVDPPSLTGRLIGDKRVRLATDVCDAKSTP